MTVAPFPHPRSTRRLAPRPAPPPREPLGRRLLHGLSYTAAVALGLTVAPALVILSDRGTFLHWANYLLDIVGSH